MLKYCVADVSEDYSPCKDSLQDSSGTSLLSTRNQSIETSPIGGYLRLNANIVSFKIVKIYGIFSVL